MKGSSPNSPPARRVLVDHLAIRLPEIRAHVVHGRIERDDGDPLVWSGVQAARDGRREECPREAPISLGEVEVLPRLLIHTQPARVKIFSASLGSTSCRSIV